MLTEYSQAEVWPIWYAQTTIVKCANGFAYMHESAKWKQNRTDFATVRAHTRTQADTLAELTFPIALSLSKPLAEDVELAFDFVYVNAWIGKGRVVYLTTFLYKLTKETDIHIKWKSTVKRSDLIMR